MSSSSRRVTTDRVAAPDTTALAALSDADLCVLLGRTWGRDPRADRRVLDALAAKGAPAPPSVAVLLLACLCEQEVRRERQQQED